METCHYDRGHWPCSHCYAKSPDSEDACCKFPEKEEKLVCPLCGKEVAFFERWANSLYGSICCTNIECLRPETGMLLRSEAIAKWKKYAR